MSAVEDELVMAQVAPTRAVEQLVVQEPSTEDDNDIQYPTGVKVYVSLACLYASFFLNGLDLTIVAVAVPSITDHFHTLEDIGWYSAAYGMVGAALSFLFGKACTVFPPKQLVIYGLGVFTIGSALCTFATSSAMLILGRAVCGVGVGMTSSSSLVAISNMFPNHKRAFWMSTAGTAQAAGLTLAPFLGGLLIDRFSWRACFGINLPLCPLCLGLTAYFMEDPFHRPEFDLPLLSKLKKLDVFSTVIFVPSITCLLIALQWGGIKYGWADRQIIALLIVFGVLLAIFVGMQYYHGQDATIPGRLLKQRSVLASMWFGTCTNGILALTEYYISIYFQGIKGYSATRAGLLGLPMIAGLAVSSTLSGLSISKIGYYTPHMYLTSLLAPIASGLLTTLKLDDTPAKAAGLVGFLGFAIGVGNIAPAVAITTVLPQKDVAVGLALGGFCGRLASALFLSISTSLFQSRLIHEINSQAPGVNATLIEHSGLSDIRHAVGSERLGQVLAGYDDAVVQTLYLPLALTLCTIVATLSMEWVSVKKKQQ